MLEKNAVIRRYIKNEEGLLRLPGLLPGKYKLVPSAIRIDEVRTRLKVTTKSGELVVEVEAGKETNTDITVTEISEVE